MKSLPITLILVGAFLPVADASANPIRKLLDVSAMRAALEADDWSEVRCVSRTSFDRPVVECTAVRGTDAALVHLSKATIDDATFWWLDQMAVTDRGPFAMQVSVSQSEAANLVLSAFEPVRGPLGLTDALSILKAEGWVIGDQVLDSDASGSGWALELQDNRHHRPGLLKALTQGFQNTDWGEVRWRPNSHPRAVANPSPGTAVLTTEHGTLEATMVTRAASLELLETLLDYP